MQLARPVRPTAFAVLGTLIFSLGCSGRDALIQPPVLSPLAGLNESPARDSTGAVPPPPVGALQPGDINGTVLGPSPVGAGGDTLATAPRIAGVEITVYPVLDESGPLPEVGPPIASTATGADGKFSLPDLPGGPVVVTFEPPAASAYAGTWSTTVIHGGSGDHPWWVVLPRK
jgi:hypothetical protein